MRPAYPARDQRPAELGTRPSRVPVAGSAIGTLVSHDEMHGYRVRGLTIPGRCAGHAACPRGEAGPDCRVRGAASGYGAAGR